MVKRRALNESIQFEIPGSPTYNALVQQVRDIDSYKFNIRTPNAIVGTKQTVPN